MSLRSSMVAMMMLALAPTVPAADGAATPLVALSGEAPCGRCDGHRLPGRHEPSPHTRHRIDSAHPRVFTTTGVLHRTGTDPIDASFEVQLNHRSINQPPGESRRVVIYVINRGSEDAEISPVQAMFHGEGAAELGRAVLGEAWAPLPPLTIPPGQGRVVGWTRQIAAPTDDIDEARSDAVVGCLRAEVASATGEAVQLEVVVLAIPGSDDFDGPLADVAPWLDQTAQAAPEQPAPAAACLPAPAATIAANTLWRAEPLSLDVTALPATGIAFPMTTPTDSASTDCVNQRWSGATMVEQWLEVSVANPSEMVRAFDLQFAAPTDAAPVGLAYQVAWGSAPLSARALESLPVVAQWTGSQPAAPRSFLGAPVTLPPGQQLTVSIRLLVLPGSAAPWRLMVLPAEPVKRPSMDDSEDMY